MDGEKIELIAPNTSQRLDKFIVASLGDQFSRSQVQSLIQDEYVSVDGAPAKSSLKLKGGEKVVIRLPEKNNDDLVQPEDIPLDILYDDEFIAVVNKSAGMIVHPGAGNETGTLVAALLAKYPNMAEMDHSQKRTGIVHRLDKDTSGLLVIAKTDPMRRRLMQQFQERTVDKTYVALLENTPKTRDGRIELPIARNPNQRHKMAVRREGKPAVSEFWVRPEEFEDDRALVDVKILTGRTHQIRVHMAYIGCPVVGDKMYGYRKQRIKLNRHFLHASRLAFDHPETGERLEFESELPIKLQHILDRWRIQKTE